MAAGVKNALTAVAVAILTTLAAAWNAVDVARAAPLGVSLDDPTRPYAPHSRRSHSRTQPKKPPLILQSIIKGTNRPIAIINGYTFVVGETIRGHGEIKRIDEDTVVIDWGGRTQVLHMMPSIVSNIRIPEPDHDSAETPIE